MAPVNVTMISLQEVWAVYHVAKIVQKQ